MVPLNVHPGRTIRRIKAIMDMNAAARRIGTNTNNFMSPTTPMRRKLRQTKTWKAMSRVDRVRSSCVSKSTSSDEYSTDIKTPRLEALRNPMAKPWALGWLADREYFIELGRVLNLCQGSAAEDIIKLEAAAIHHVTSKTWWPNLVECIVDGSSEHVFASMSTTNDDRIPHHPFSAPSLYLASIATVLTSTCH